MMNGKKILHLQMKGSGKPKYISWGYHSMMFHMYNNMLDEKYAKKMTSRGGIGLSKFLYEQLKEKKD